MFCSIIKADSKTLAHAVDSDLYYFRKQRLDISLKMSEAVMASDLDRVDLMANNLRSVTAAIELLEELAAHVAAGNPAGGYVVDLAKTLAWLGSNESNPPTKQELRHCEVGWELIDCLTK